MMTGNGGWDGYDEGYDHAMSTGFDDGESVLSRTRLVFLADDDTMQPRGIFSSTGASCTGSVCV
jgi:hypothetical protein